jgi:hypothetical protein
LNEKIRDDNEEEEDYSEGKCCLLHCYLSK